MSNPIDRSDALDKKLEAATPEQIIDGIMRSAQKTRKMTWLAIAGLTMDFILSIIGVFLWVRTDSAVEHAQTNEEAAFATCTASNETRAGNKTLWHHVLAESLRQPEDKPTAAEFEQIVQFRQFVDDLFAPRDCEAIRVGSSGDDPPSPIPTPTSRPPRTPAV